MCSAMAAWIVQPLCRQEVAGSIPNGKELKFERLSLFVSVQIVIIISNFTRNKFKSLMLHFPSAILRRYNQVLQYPILNKVCF